jgi:hypothetical protein
MSDRKHLTREDETTYLLVRKLSRTELEGKMKRVISFLVLHLSFVILCVSANAQWEGAEIQRLTHNEVPNTKIHEFCIDQNDKLYLFYVEGIRDTATGFVYRSELLFSGKDKDGSWSQPEETGSPDGLIWGTVRVVHDVRTGITHFATVANHSLAYDTLYYTNSQLPDWERSKVDSLSYEYNAIYGQLQMALDSLGNVHLVWHVDFDSASFSWYRLMYANNSTGQWIKQRISPSVFLGGMGSGASYLAVQKNGVVHIVYHGDVDGSDIPYYYVRNDSLNSEVWHLDTIPRPSRPIWSYGGGPLKIDSNDILHLLTWGCIQPGYCIDDGLHRTFYYYKESDDSVWHGGDLILDSLFYPAELFVDSESTPHLLEWDPSTFCWFFTHRKQGFWQERYRIFDTTTTCHEPSSVYVSGPSFVLDSERQGHAVFSGCLFEFVAQDDSLEILYYSSPPSSVEGPMEEQTEFGPKLLQNYPNPFNQTTLIRYSLSIAHPIRTTLRIYNILGEEVRELVNTNQSRGRYQVFWNATNDSGKEVSSGIYFCVLRHGERKEAKTMLLIK